MKIGWWINNWNNIEEQGLCLYLGRIQNTTIKNEKWLTKQE